MAQLFQQTRLQGGILDLPLSASKTRGQACHKHVPAFRLMNTI